MPGVMMVRQKVRTKRQMFKLLEERIAIHIFLRDCSLCYQSRSGTYTVGVGRQRYSIGAEHVGMSRCCPCAGSQATDKKGQQSSLWRFEKTLTSGWPNSFPSKFKYPSPPSE